MGRTVHYKIFMNEEQLEEEWPEIERMQKAMNEQFTWTVERLSLCPTTDKDYETCFDARYRAQYKGVPSAWGFTKIGDDEWNAALIFRFMAWVSDYLSGARITVEDEGGYALLSHLELSGGHFKVDPAHVQRQRDYLRWTGGRHLIPDLEVAVAHSLDRKFFSDVSAAGYLDRKEIRALGLPVTELVRLNLEQVANCIRFPWEPAPSAEKAV